MRDPDGDGEAVDVADAVVDTVVDAVRLKETVWVPEVDPEAVPVTVPVVLTVTEPDAELVALADVVLVTDCVDVVVAEKLSDTVGLGVGEAEVEYEAVVLAVGL